MKYVRLLPINEFLSVHIKIYGSIWRVEDLDNSCNYMALESIDGREKRIVVSPNNVVDSDIEEVKPRVVFIEQRISELTNDIDNYVKKGYTPNVEWGEELLDRISELNEIKEVS